VIRPRRALGAGDYRLTLRGSGGGLRNAYGDVFAQSQLPAHHLDTGTDIWAGQLGRFIASGGDLRFDGSVQQLPHTQTLSEFQLQQTRLYLEADVLPERLHAAVLSAPR